MGSERGLTKLASGNRKSKHLIPSRAEFWETYTVTVAVEPEEVAAAVAPPLAVGLEGVTAAVATSLTVLAKYPSEVQ